MSGNEYLVLIDIGSYHTYVYVSDIRSAIKPMEIIKGRSKYFLVKRESKIEKLDLVSEELGIRGGGSGYLSTSMKYECVYGIAPEAPESDDEDDSEDSSDEVQVEDDKSWYVTYSTPTRVIHYENGKSVDSDGKPEEKYTNITFLYYWLFREIIRKVSMKAGETEKFDGSYWMIGVPSVFDKHSIDWLNYLFISALKREENLRSVPLENYRVMFVRESEAASFELLENIDKGTSTKKDEEVMVVLDMGGSTTDISVFIQAWKKEKKRQDVRYYYEVGIKGLPAGGIEFNRAIEKVDKTSDSERIKRKYLGSKFKALTKAEKAMDKVLEKQTKQIVNAIKDIWRSADTSEYKPVRFQIYFSGGASNAEKVKERILEVANKELCKLISNSKKRKGECVVEYKRISLDEADMDVINGMRMMLRRYEQDKEYGEDEYLRLRYLKVIKDTIVAINEKSNRIKVLSDNMVEKRRNYSDSIPVPEDVLSDNGEDYELSLFFRTEKLPEEDVEWIKETEKKIKKDKTIMKSDIEEWKRKRKLKHLYILMRNFSKVVRVVGGAKDGEGSKSMAKWIVNEVISREIFYKRTYLIKKNALASKKVEVSFWNANYDVIYEGKDGEERMALSLPRLSGK